MSAATAEDRRWLDAAARQAMPLLGGTGDKPPIAALIVDPRTGRLLGRAGGPEAGQGEHPISLALADAGESARGATLYVTLAENDAALVGQVSAAGIARLISGLDLSDPKSGQGDIATRLADAGIACASADSPTCRRLYEGNLSRRNRGRPYVTATLAVSAANRLVAIEGDGVDSASLRWRQVQRAASEALLVGWGQASRENPSLEIGIDDGVATRKPLPVLVAGRRTYNPQMQLLQPENGKPVAVLTIAEKKLEQPPVVDLIRVTTASGRPDPKAGFEALAKRGVQNALVEGGAALVESLLAANLIDRFHLQLIDGIPQPGGPPASPRGPIEARLVAAGFSLVDHRLLGADNLRTFERMF